MLKFTLNFPFATYAAETCIRCTGALCAYLGQLTYKSISLRGAKSTKNISYGHTGFLYIVNGQDLRGATREVLLKDYAI